MSIFAKNDKMAQHNTLGKTGEDMACRFLQDKGYEILERNWTWRKLELDIIARKDDCLIIAEIRTRSTNMYGEPEDTVSEKKIRRIIKRMMSMPTFEEYNRDFKFSSKNLSSSDLYFL